MAWGKGSGVDRERTFGIESIVGFYKLINCFLGYFTVSLG